MTLHQAQALANIDSSVWFGIDLRNAAVDKIPFGGVVTLVNFKGDVMKVYGDGTTQIVTSEQFTAMRNA